MNWPSFKIKDLCDITSSKRIYAKDYLPEGVPFYRGKEIIEKYNGAVEISTQLFISPNKYEEIKSKFGVPQYGDILLSSVGTLGVPFQVNNQQEFYFKDGNLTWFRNFKEICSRYLYYWLVSPEGKMQLQKCTIGTSQSAYTIVRLKEMEISLPPQGQQEDIASILSAYDDLIENNRRRIQLLEESARLLYKEWFVHLRFPGHEHTKIIDGVPEGWKNKPLGQLCYQYKKTIKPDEVSPDTPYIGLGNIPRRSITISDWETSEKITSSKYVFQEGDILFGKIRPYFHKVGFTLCNGITSSDSVVLRAKEEKYYCYILAYVSSDNFVKLASKTCREGAKMPRADWKYLEKQAVLVPSKMLLMEFSEQQNKILKQLKTLAHYNQKLAQARDLLLPRLMNGEIEV